MKNLSVLFMCLLISSAVLAEKSRTIEKHFQTKPSQKIELKNFSGSEIKIKSWDKDEVYIKLKVKASSSDDKWEEAYIKAADISESNDESSLVLTFKETREKSGSYIFGIKVTFIKFFHYESRDKYGEIYIPKNNAFTTDFKYGSISLADMKGDIDLYGGSNTLELRNCSSVNRIENNYGNTKINNCGGNLVLQGTSSEVNVYNFKGESIINANYSTINAENVSSNLAINSTSGTHTISNIRGNLKVNSNYSTIKINDVEGFVDVQSTSANIIIKKVQGVNVNSNYSTVNISSINGKANKDIFIKGTSGKLEADDLVGNVIIDNPYSDMFLKNIKGDVKISGKSSRIDGNNITGNWDSETEYSTIKINQLNAKEIKMTNKSDPIILNLKSVPNFIDIKNQYGKVDVSMPRGYLGEIELTAEYGNIETDFPMKTKTLGSSAYSVGKIGVGSGMINIETKSADIVLNQQ